MFGNLSRGDLARCEACGYTFVVVGRRLPCRRCGGQALRNLTERRVVARHWAW